MKIAQRSIPDFVFFTARSASIGSTVSCGFFAFGNVGSAAILSSRRSVSLLSFCSRFVARNISLDRMPDFGVSEDLERIGRFVWFLALTGTTGGGEAAIGSVTSAHVAVLFAD